LKELPSSIGQLNALQELGLNGCSNLKDPTWKNYLHLLVNWIHSNFSFIKFLQLENILKKIHSSMGKLNALKVFHLSRQSNLK
jgi:hypothetical protein